MKRLLVALLCAAPMSLRGADGPASTCSKFSSPEDVLACVLQNHPEIVRLKTQAANIGAFEALAQQRPNPEIEAETLHASEDDRPSLEVEAAYLHTFETGGKRRRRLDRAQAEKELVLAQLDRTKEEIKLRTVLNLHRLRQIEHEVHIVDEAVETFGEIIRQYRSRSRLSPEQQVSLNIFILAEGDYRLRRSGLLQERRNIRQFFDLATGAGFQNILNTLPPRPQEWPSVTAATDAGALGGASRREALAEVAVAQAELGLAAAEAAPNVGLGPRLASESGNGQNSTSFGAALSMALPLYNRNRGGRAVADYELKRAQAILAQRDKEFETAFQSWAEIYQEAVGALKEIPSLEQLEKKHSNIEEQFQRGLISASLVIEAHRQMTDFASSQNEQELRAAEALWSIRALQGRILEEKL